MAEWLIEVRGKKYSVPSLEALQAWVRGGKVDRSYAVYSPRTSDWRPAGEVDELRDLFPAADSHPSAVPAGIATSVLTSEPERLPLWLVDVGGKQYRAHDIEKVKLWAIEGRIRPETRIFDPRCAGWIEARDVPEVRDAFLVDEPPLLTREEDAAASNRTSAIGIASRPSSASRSVISEPAPVDLAGNGSIHADRTRNSRVKRYGIAAALVLAFLFTAGRSLQSTGRTLASVVDDPEHIDLPVTVHTVGDRKIGVDLNSGLANVRMTKNESVGTVTISFDWHESKSNIPYYTSDGFLVRLFDKNGNYLTHFTTEPLRDLLGRQHMNSSMRQDWADNHYDLTYSVNLRDLQPAAQAEFGVILR